MGIASVPARAGTKAAVPEARIDLESIGFPGFSKAAVEAGGSMLTVHFVDSKHLLVTYAKRGLIQRLPDDAHEETRVVATKLLELPSGNVVAETEWRLHDHSRYLWNLGDGRFLLRDRNALSTFAPLANLATGKPFEQTPLEHRAGDVRVIVVSSDFKVLTIETSAPLPPDASTGTLPTLDAAERPVFLEFFRYSGAGQKDAPLVVEKAGAARSQRAVLLPVDSDGFLEADGGRNNQDWKVNYQPFDGKPIALAPMDSSCSPELWTAGRGFALAVTCPRSTGHIKLLALDFAKHELWEEPFPTPPLPLSFSFSPTAVRFALSRTESASESLMDGPLDPSAVQEVRVYQGQTGDLLLKIDSEPISRTAENFDLSGDGTRLAVVRKGAVVVYALRGLSASDHADFAEMEKFGPPPGTGPIGFSAAEVEKGNSGDASAASVRNQPQQPNATAAANAVGGDDPDNQSPRKPPTLLNPGEKTEH